jgi:hypothetical protein
MCNYSCNHYRIVRSYLDKYPNHRTILYGLTLEQAREHCNNPETSSSTCKTEKGKRITRRNGPWFDGYQHEERQDK